MMTGLTSSELLNTAISLCVAFVLGILIGAERQFRQRTAGLSAAFVDLGVRVAGHDGAVRVISYVVSGIGFLGAGVIMKEGTQVRGLNTAATLWASAAVGAFAGARQTGEAVLVAGFVLAGNTLLRPLVNFINRRPITPGETEALYRVHVICEPEEVSRVRDLLFEELERHHYPIGEIEMLSDTEDVVELAADLLPTSADPEELDTVVEHLERSPSVASATWTVSTMN